jgi:methylated-DNA-[protein]-cysteine S-methyltransferase
MQNVMRTIETPVGPLTLVANDQGLVAVLSKKQKTFSCPKDPDHPVLNLAEKQLLEYFRGERQDFSIPLSLQGSRFQLQIWAELQKIPYGETRSYGQMAKNIKKPGAARAVGLANSKNPAMIVVPCHRVIGADGSLTGFAGGLDAKAALLNLEKAEFKI